MNRIQVHFALSVFALSALVITPARADVVAQWTFETSQPVTAGLYNPELGAGQASGLHAGASTYSSPSGNGSAHSYSSNTWAVGDYYQFTISTAGFQGVKVSWDQTSSNTGPKDFNLEYSINGSAFTVSSSYSVLANAAPNPVWNTTTSSSLYSFTADFSANTAFDGQSSVIFRLIDTSTVSANGGAVAAAGTDRVDNFTVTASAAAVPEPSSMLLVGLAVAGGLGFRRCRRVGNNAAARDFAGIS